MRATIKPANFSGTYKIPASKSHTIRRLLLSAMTDGESFIEEPLDSLDARSCLAAIRALGASVEEIRGISADCPNTADENGKKLIAWRVKGINPENIGALKAVDEIDVGNSGTTLFLALAIAALGKNPVRFTGDEQIRRRSAADLVNALSGLGIKVTSENGYAPITVQGPWKGGRVTLPCPTSQYLSAILLAAPLAPAGTLTEIDVPLLNEKPYIEMTLSYLDAQKIPYKKSDDFSFFSIPGGAAYKPINGFVTGDFSSAAFPVCAALTCDSGNVTLLGLDPHDSQGDKILLDMLSQMGADIKWSKTDNKWELHVSRSKRLKGGTFDLNASPDLLPVMSALAAYSEGETALVNVAHARIKETDRIAVMAQELAKVGIKTEERPDALIIHGGEVHGGNINGHGDHRIVMAFAVAALGAKGAITIEGAEAASVTYPGFLEHLGAEIVN